MLVVGGSCVRAWSSTQATVATSSGEAELYALVKASSEGLGFASVARDLGIELKLELFVDSTAAQAISSRAGLGKTKHVEVKYLWVQEATQRGLLKVKRIPGEQNPADILTKPHAARRLCEVLRGVGLSIQSCDANALIVDPSGDFNAEAYLEEGVEIQFGEHLPVQACTEGSRIKWADVEGSDDDFSMFNFGPIDPGGAGSEGGC
jgi:hypothetical protein